MAEQQPEPTRWVGNGPVTFPEGYDETPPGPEVPPNPCDDHDEDCKCVGCVRRVMD